MGQEKILSLFRFPAIPKYIDTAETRVGSQDFQKISKALAADGDRPQPPPTGATVSAILDLLTRMRHAGVLQDFRPIVENFR